MINLIVHWTGDWDALLENNEFNFYMPFTRVMEMQDDVWMIALKVADDWDSLELAMEAVDDVTVIGTYNQDGSQYLWGNATSRNHTIQKYHGKLRNKKEYDEDGNLITDVPYTEAEALNVQVNKFWGWSDRELN